MANARLGARKSHATGFYDLRNWLLGNAAWLGADERRLVREALKAGGYEAYSPDTIVSEVLRLTMASPDC